MAFAEALSLGTAAPAPRPQLASIAVLPFENLSPDPDNEFFADGMMGDVIAQLSKIRSLKVISRRSVSPFKDRTKSPRAIARALDVATLLEGSVRRLEQGLAGLETAVALAPENTSFLGQLG